MLALSFGLCAAADLRSPP